MEIIQLKEIFIIFQLKLLGQAVSTTKPQQQTGLYIFDPLFSLSLQYVIATYIDLELDKQNSRIWTTSRESVSF